jgi:lipopolysaccharide export system permease protein
MRSRLTRLESYVLTQTLMAVLGALIIIGLVVFLIDFVELSRSVGVRADTNFIEILGLTLLKSPAVILQLLPFVFLFGTLAAFVDMNRRSELIAMRAAGVSAWRFIFPAAGAAFVIGLTTVVALNPLASVSNARFETLRDNLMSNYLTVAPSDIWLRQGDKHSQMVIRARSRDMVGPNVRLNGVSLFISTVNAQGDLEFSRRIEAQEARLVGKDWRLTGAKEATPGAGAVNYDSLVIPSTLDARAALARFAPPTTIPFWGLPNIISRTEQAGFSATAYRLRFQQLLATPLLFAAMSILAAAFSLRLMRLGGLTALAGSGATLGFVFFFFNSFCGALGKSEVIAPFAAAWTPPVLAFLSGFTLLCYTEDG